jgi:hypothetical protein
MSIKQFYCLANPMATAALSGVDQLHLGQLPPKARRRQPLFELARARLRCI